MHTTTLETQLSVVNSSVIYLTCENRKTIMLEKTEHNVNHHYIIYHKQIKLDQIAGGLLLCTEPILVKNI